MEKPYAIGIDIGGTNTVFGVVDKRGHIIAQGSIKTAAHKEINEEHCENVPEPVLLSPDYHHLLC